jgi:glycosyltransferase involved in cell wall biosynthesis
MNYRNRIAAFLRFAVRACWCCRNLDYDYELVFASSTPLTIAVPGIYAAARRDVPFVFEVRDLWPEAAIHMGALKSRWTIAAARLLERTAYRRASHIIALSPGIRDGILAVGVLPEKVTVVPNACDVDLFSPGVGRSAQRHALGFAEEFVCVYAGAMGAANGLDYVLDAASILRRAGVNDVIFVLQGDGSERGRLESRCASEGLTNIMFLNPTGKDGVVRLLAAADAALNIFKDMPLSHTCSPNKFFDALAAGRPVITNTSGWLQQLVETYRMGLFAEPAEPAQLAQQVLSLKRAPELCVEMGHNARHVAQECFSRDLLVRQIEHVLVSTAGTNSGGK